MATIQGHKGSLLNGSSVKIGELTNFSFTVNGNNEQFNAFGSEWMNTIATNKGWSVEGSGKYDPDDTLQGAIVDDILTGDRSYAIEMRPEGDTVGDVEFTGTIIIDDVNIEASAEGVIAFSFSGTGHGAPVKGSVAA